MASFLIKRVHGPRWRWVLRDETTVIARSEHAWWDIEDCIAAARAVKDHASDAPIEIES
jgi:uncharacterized protein YegP (UPF0339 family)